MLCAFTCARALAELHAVGIVHGDIASENILIDPHTLSAKLIDFDMASIEGTSMQAGGNPDFINYEMKTAIKNNKKIKS